VTGRALAAEPSGKSLNTLAEEVFETATVSGDTFP
jgi:predicted HicB family RNase H-like nuclease